MPGRRAAGAALRGRLASGLAVVVLPAGAWPCVWVWSVDVVSVWSVEVVPVSLDVLDVPVEVCASASAPGGRRELGHRRGHDVMGGVVAAAGAQAQARDGEEGDHVRTHVKRG